MVFFDFFDFLARFRNRFILDIFILFLGMPVYILPILKRIWPGLRVSHSSPHTMVNGFTSDIIGEIVSITPKNKTLYTIVYVTDVYITKCQLEERKDRRYISNRGYCVRLNRIPRRLLIKLKTKMTIVPIVSDKYDTGIEPHTLYSQTKTHLIMPKFYGIKRYRNTLNRRFKPISIAAKCLVPPRPYQRKALKQCIRTLRDRGGGVLKVFCGWGKTYGAIHICAELGVKTMIIVPTGDLLEQWRERIQEFMPAARIGIVRGKYKQMVDNDIILCMMQSLSQKDYPANFFDSIGLIVYDEIHRFSTTTFKHCFMKIAAPYMLGLSATPQREDGCEAIFHHFLGPVMYEEKRKANNDIVVEAIEYTIPGFRPEMIYNGELSYVKTLVKACMAPNRINYICERIIEFCEQGRIILTIGQYIKHLKEMRRVLIMMDKSKFKLKDAKGKPTTKYTYALYVGSTKLKDREIAKESAHVLLGTYNLVAEGFDHKKLNTLVLSSPRKANKIEQIVGRILRDVNADTKPYILDIIDQFYAFKHMGNKRIKFLHEEYDYTVTRQQVISGNPHSSKPKATTSSKATKATKSSKATKTSKATKKPKSRASKSKKANVCRFELSD